MKPAFWLCVDLQSVWYSSLVRHSGKADAPNRISNDEEMNIILLRLVEYLGHTNPFVCAVAYAEVCIWIMSSFLLSFLFFQSHIYKFSLPLYPSSLIDISFPNLRNTPHRPLLAYFDRIGGRFLWQSRKTSNIARIWPSSSVIYWEWK